MHGGGDSEEPSGQEHETNLDRILALIDELEALVAVELVAQRDALNQIRTGLGLKEVK